MCAQPGGRKRHTIRDMMTCDDDEGDGSSDEYKHSLVHLEKPSSYGTLSSSFL